MSTAPLLWALAFTCISAAADPVPPPAAEVLRLELEAELARRPDLYLVVDLENRALEIKARGLVLESVPLDRAELLIYRRPGGEEAVPPPALPAVWEVSEAPAGSGRRLVSQRRLKPWKPEAAAEEEAPDEAAGEPGGEGRLEVAAPVPGGAYRVPLTGGWQLALSEGDRPGGRGSALSLRRGWLRLWGEEEPHPPLLSLTLDGENLRHLHHLFEPGRRLLVVAGPPTFHFAPRGIGSHNPR